ncbi:MAG: protein kinase domain-containing protein, partial [Planctomycetota bacterium]
MSLVDEVSANGLSTQACGVCLQGRYEVVRELGRGGMGAVFLVADRRRGGRLLALKKVRVSPTDAEAAEALRNEFLAVASLRHPGLAEIYDFGIDRSSSEYFFTSEFVQGTNFYEALRRRDPARSEDAGAIVELAAQVLRALEFLHTRGIVHGDIKPENILVTGLSEDEPASARAKLIDFGLARREKQFGGRNVVGTLYYIAPETITGSQVDRRTDLYSFGCVLFHVLTGVPPFASPENVEILRGHLERPPTKPSHLRPGIPEWLERFILRLVEKNPASRYASALEALAALSESSERPLPLETPETLRSYVECVRPGNVESQLAAVFGAFRASCRARGGPVLRNLHVALEDRSSAAGRPARAAQVPDGRFVVVRGEDSLAKAQLAEAFRRLVQAQGAHFLSVECGAPDGSHADFLALLEEIRSLASATGRAGPLLADCDALETSVNSGDPPADIVPAFEGFARHLLDASLEAPVVLHLCGFDRAGDLVAGFARRLIEEEVEKTFPANQVFVLATTGSAGGGTPGLRRILRSTKSREGALELDVGRLEEASTSRFLDAVFPGHDFPESLSRTLYEESGGETSSVVAILRFLLEGGTIARTPNGWTLAGKIREEEFPPQVRETLRAKLRDLPEDARTVARAFAVLGDGTELDLAAGLAGLPTKDLIEPMRRLREVGIIEEDGERLGVYSFAHPRARELLDREIPEGERRGLHRRAAALRAAREGDEGEASVHLLRSGDGAAGAPAGIAAAKRLAEAGDLKEAIRVYDEVLRAAGASDPAVSEEVAYEKARLLHELARYREALEILAPLADARRVDGRAPHPTLVFVAAAASATRLGEHRRAAEYLDRAAAVEKSQLFPVSLVYVLGGYAELAAELERWGDCAKYCERVLEDRERIHDRRFLRHVHLLLAEACRAGAGADRAAALCREAVELADSADRGAWLESSLAVLARYCEYRGKYVEAAKLLQARIALRRRRGLAEASGRAYLDLGRLEAALERTRAAART